MWFWNIVHFIIWRVYYMCRISFLILSWHIKLYIFMGYYVILLCAYVILFKSELIYLYPQIYIISGWWKYSVSFVLAILKYKLFTICGNFLMQLNTVTISFFKFYLFIYSIYMCFAYMFVSLRCTAWCLWRPQESAGPSIMSCHVDSGTQTQVLWERSQTS